MTKQDLWMMALCDVILIFNFGKPRLEWKRIFPPKQILDHRRKRWKYGENSVGE